VSKRVLSGYLKNAGSGVSMDIFECMDANKINYKRLEKDLRKLMQMDDFRKWQFLLNIISDETELNNLEIAREFADAVEDYDGSFLMQYRWQEIKMKGDLPKNVKLTIRSNENESTLL